MNERKKYQAIIIIGGLIVVFIVLLRNVMPVKLNFFLIGAVIGWFSSIALFHSLSAEKKHQRRKARYNKEYEELEKIISSKGYKNLQS